MTRICNRFTLHDLPNMYRLDIRQPSTEKNQLNKFGFLLRMSRTTNRESPT